MIHNKDRLIFFYQLESFSYECERIGKLILLSSTLQKDLQQDFAIRNGKDAPVHLGSDCTA